MNYSYHGKNIGGAPKGSDPVGVMKNWLKKHQKKYKIVLPSKLTKKACWKIIQKIKKDYAHEHKNAEKLAREYGLIILRLPPYHCEL